MLEGTEKGGVRNSIHNCLTVFQYDPILSGAVAKNLLTERIDLLKPTLSRYMSKVSVVIPMYNSEKTIEQVLGSVI